MKQLTPRSKPPVHEIKTGRKLLTVKGLAFQLSMTPETIYRQIKEGTLPFPYIKIGRNIRFVESDINKWIDAQWRYYDRPVYGP